jgi:hypothetical protein
VFTVEYCKFKADFYALQMEAASAEQRERLLLLHRSYTLLARNAAFWAGTNNSSISATR